MKEALTLSDAVAQSAASVHLSHPDPVVGSRVRVFRSSLTGKYQHHHSLSLPHAFLASRTSSTCRFDVPSSADDSQPVSRIGSSSHAAFSSPGRLLHSLEEAPSRSDAVVLPASGQPSRPGPAFGCHEGVFQAPHIGEYCQAIIPSRPDDSLAYSPHLDKSSPSRLVTGTPPIRINRRRPTRGRHQSAVSSRRESLNIYYQNVGGMNTRALEYRLACSACTFDILVLTEHWLKPATLSHQVFGTEYDVFRCNRKQFVNSSKEDGGGVAIAVRQGLHARPIDKKEWECVELVWVAIDFPDRTLFICSVYIPPDQIRNKKLFETVAASVSVISSMARPADELIVFGDFNLPELQWRSSRDGFLYPDPVLSTKPPHIAEFLDNLCTATLQQINSFVNENDVILDLCFVSCLDSAPPLSLAPAPLVKEALHHPALLLSMPVCRAVEFKPTVSQVSYDFSKSNVNGILELLFSINWDSVLDKDDIEAAVLTFTHVLSYAIDMYVPKRSTPNNRVPWQTSELRRLKSSKRSALRMFSKHRTLPLRDHYTKLNQCYKLLSKRCYANYETRTQRKLKTNPKSFWKHINEQRKESGLPTSMFLKGQVGSNTEEICQLFATKFSSMFVRETLSSEQVTVAASNVPPHGMALDRIVIDDSMILNAASKLKASTTAGPDGIPSIILKKCIAGLVEPLRLLFNLSLTAGSFPSLWKSAFMFPVHKKGDKRNADNYRGISALCAVSKLFELVVIAPVFFFCKNLISDDQHGYLPGRSTMTNLLTFTTFVTDGFTEGSQTDAVFTDLSAAFDRLNHQIAIAKLDRIGINGTLLRWFESYLTGRELRVKIADCLSELFKPFSGIAQGSHLGPLVFLLYYNDCNHVLAVPRLSYADDMKIFNRIDSASDAWNLQQQLDIFADWCDKNRMVLNPHKCVVVSYSRRENPIKFEYRLCDVPVPRENCFKDLGVLLDSKLEYKQHTSFIVAKASRQLGFVFRATKNFTDIYCIKALYCALVRPTLEYCSAVWSPYYDNGVVKIESVQRRFIRFALRLLPWRDPQRLPSYQSRCKLINLDTLDTRRNVSRALAVADLLTSRIHCPALLRGLNIQAPLRSLRNSAFLRLPFRRTNYGMHSALIGLHRAFNSVAAVFDFNLTRNVVKQKFFMFLRR